MKITKFGHCCLLVEVRGVRILTDPGSFSVGQDVVGKVNLVLITHEHQDHIHIDSLKNILSNNPQATIITNTAVGKLLEKENIAFVLLEDGQKYNYEKLSIEGVGKDHAFMFQGIPVVQNTGFLIGGDLFYPGDAFPKISQKFSVLALPVSGPWMKLSEALEYAEMVKPKICFPVHDALLSQVGMNVTCRISKMVLEKSGIEFREIKIGEEMEF
ncbi:MAG: MBL fold metallo-hydrolase [Candidatus Paceibacterota bacterium]|jgi:L-ascorbate metabolism protein UlaG (beta-lactamase superfamily)